jgi:sulfate permease, SulP family
MAPYRRILVPLACAQPDWELLAYAAMLCRIQNGAQVDLVHIDPRPGSREEIDAVAAAFREQAGGSTGCTGHLLIGDLTDRLLEFAAQDRNDLILLGHQLAHSGRRALARRLAMKAPCSVWMVPEGSPATIRRIIAPVDLSARSADALADAAIIAALAGLEEITVLHVYFDPTTVTFSEWDTLVRGGEEESMRRFLARIDLQGVNAVLRFVEARDVAHAIARLGAEEHADLVVMGTRGRSNAAAVLLGSETEHVMVESHIPLLAVKHFGARRSLLQALLDPRLRGREEAHFG